MMTHFYKFYISEDKPNKIVTPGINNGYGVGSEIDLLHKAGKYMVIRFPGCSDWSGRASTSYFPTEYVIAEIVNYGGCIGEHFKIVKKVEPGRQWKKYKQEFIERCNELAQKGIEQDVQQKT